MPIFPARKSRPTPSFARPRRARGSSVLEMALVLPILVSLSFGVAEYGFYFFVKNTMQGAVTAGSRVGTTTSPTNSSVTTAVQNMMSASGFSSGNYTVSITDTQGNALDLSSAGSKVAFEVTVSANWGTIGVHVLPAYLGGMPTSKQVTATAAAFTQ
jgi:Flp pilus assembly protein TadG